MRGEDQRVVGQPKRSVGITPACAGKTSAPVARCGVVADHPRMRGEDLRSRTIRSLRIGSPPHARGRLTRETSRSSPPGITPACAGKTGMRLYPARTTADHPRMRGEDSVTTVPSSSTNGSPPHARGRLVRDRPRSLTRRITPACAGKTSKNQTAKSSKPDHPRMRGEDALTIDCLPHPGRITPACAGKTVRFDCSTS